MQNDSLKILGVPPNVWTVDETTVDITRQPLRTKLVVIKTETKTINLDLAKTVIQVIDMQNDFCYPDGWLGHIGVDVTPARSPIQPLINLLPKLRSQNVPIIWQNWENRPDLKNIVHR